MSCLSNFQIIRPKFEISQAESLEWLARAHAKAEARKEGWEEGGHQHVEFQERLKERFFRLGAGPRKVQNRGTMLSDFCTENWKEMRIYCLEEKERGHSLTERTARFSQEVEKIFEQFYPEETPLPDQIVHVTCTGYSAPSAAQKIVSKRKAPSIVTHAYHMGCYAAIPAIRLATNALPQARQVDVVHTEFCSLHINPQAHEIEQIIVESLFADGFIKYTITQEERVKKSPYLRLIALHEEILPDTLNQMSWDLEDWGFKMFIARDIPFLIANAIENFLEKLCEKGGYSFSQLRHESFYAFHPGGPKILEQIASLLKLNLEQLNPSFQVLREYGNMSSATLPHIWERFLKDPSIPQNTPVIGMTYGPGLTMCGGLFIKCIS